MCKCVLTVLDWTRWSNLGVIVAIILGLVGVNQYREMNRPYIGVTDYDIDQGLEGTSEIKWNKRSAEITNAGNLPAHIKISFSGGFLPGAKIRALQPDENYLMPGQKMVIGFEEELQIGKTYTGSQVPKDICDQILNDQIVIEYGLVDRELSYKTILRREQLDLPETGKPKITAHGCRSNESPQFFPWKIIEAD